MITKEELIAFEQDIADEFNAGKIRAPIHLSGGNEDQLIEIFKSIHPHDWVCTTWRSHYHCLLKGVSPAQLTTDIMMGRSITLCYPEHKIISSAIVGGVVPIALGLAWACKNHPDRSAWWPWQPPAVWCFVGDMTSMSGIFHECLRYADGHDLPITFVIEDNGKSVDTPTLEVWGKGTRESLMDYKYVLPWPHSGAGKRVEF